MAVQLDAHVLQRRAVLERFVQEELRELEVQAAHADEPQLRRLRAQVAARSAEHGLYGLTQPREAGGTQATALETVVMRETLARANVPLLASAVFGGGAGPLEAATGRLRSHYLVPTLRGQLRGSFGFTEPGGGIPRTVAIKDGDDLVLTGHKSFVTGGDSANWCAVLARLREPDGKGKAGTALIIVDLFGPDEVSRPKGVHVDRVFRSLDGGSSHAYLRFERVRVPCWHTLGGGAERLGHGLRVALRQIGAVRLAISATAVGSALWVLDYLREVVLVQPRKGGALGEKESVRLRHADMVVQVMAARASLYRIAGLVTAAAMEAEKANAAAVANEGADGVQVADPLRQYRSEVAALKVLATETAGKVVDEAIQLVGGSALVEGHPLEALYRRARAWRLTEGANDVLRLQISAQALAGEARL